MALLEMDRGMNRCEIMPGNKGSDARIPARSVGCWRFGVIDDQNLDRSSLRLQLEP